MCVVLIFLSLVSCLLSLELVIVNSSLCGFFFLPYFDLSLSLSVWPVYCFFGEERRTSHIGILIFCPENVV